MAASRQNKSSPDSHPHRCPWRHRRTGDFVFLLVLCAGGICASMRGRLGGGDDHVGDLLSSNLNSVVVAYTPAPRRDLFRSGSTGAASSVCGASGFCRGTVEPDPGLRMTVGGPAFLVGLHRLRTKVLGSKGHGEDLRPTSHKVLDLAGGLLNRLTKHLLRWCSNGFGCDGFIPLFSPTLRRRQFAEENDGVAVCRDLQGLICIISFLRVLFAMFPGKPSLRFLLVWCYVWFCNCFPI